MKILFLTNLLPYPLDNGGKIKTYSTIQSLAEAGCEIDLVCFTEDGSDKKHESVLLKSCSSVYQIYHRITTALHKEYMIKIGFRSLASRYSFGLLKYVSKEMYALLNKLSTINQYDCIFFDHLQMYVYGEQVKRLWPNARYIIDEHNCEFVIMQRNAEKSSNILKKFFLKLEAYKLRKFESNSLQKVDKVIVLSEEDEKVLKKITKGRVCTNIIPIGVQMPNVKVHHSYANLNEVKMLFIGTLSWAPNHDGLLWFLENVMPRMYLDYGKFKLYIVGKNPSEDLIRYAKTYSNVEITGYVDSVVPYYQECDFMIVPLFVGSGQRVKIIEGFSYGMPIISTSIGAEGLMYKVGENILIADSVDAFLEECQRMRNGSLRRRLSENAFTAFKKNYSIDAVKEKIVDVVLK